MPGPATDVISQEQEQALHRRLLGGDVTASAELASTFLDGLIAWLVHENDLSVPQELCIEAAEDALISLVKSPASFDPARGKRLRSYLRMSAQGDLKNILRREGRRQREKSLELVELSPQAGKYLAVLDDPSLPMEIEEESIRASKQVVEPAREGLSEVESRALDLVLQGERKTIAFAEVLGISDWPAEQQQAEVKRVKDKLKKRIEREKGGNVGPS
jgi:RNA polymerase sigma factor (sigma-70 family)